MTLIAREPPWLPISTEGEGLQALLSHPHDHSMKDLTLSFGTARIPTIPSQHGLCLLGLCLCHSRKFESPNRGVVCAVSFRCIFNFNHAKSAPQRKYFPGYILGHGQTLTSNYGALMKRIAI